MQDKSDYSFPENVGINKIHNIYEELKKIINTKNKKDIVLDFTSLKSMDVPALQVLASLFKDLKKKKYNVKLVGPLDPLFQDSLEELDMIRNNMENSVLFEQIEGGYVIEY